MGVLVVVKNLGEIEAVAFDIDGTLYPSWKLSLRALPHYSAHAFFFLKYGLVRNDMHRMAAIPNFRQVQAQMMARRMGCAEEKAEEMLEKIIYGHLKKYFQKIRCFRDVPETFEKFRSAGLKLALLSDFPPEQKGDVWGVKKYCDVVLGTEAAGALKPDPHSFMQLSESLGVPPEKILYVGNSRKYDVVGARNAGMKSAFILTGFRKFFGLRLREADFCFSNYRQLQKIVLE